MPQFLTVFVIGISCAFTPATPTVSAQKNANTNVSSTMKVRPKERYLFRKSRRALKRKRADLSVQLRTLKRDIFIHELALRKRPGTTLPRLLVVEELPDLNELRKKAKKGDFSTKYVYDDDDRVSVEQHIEGLTELAGSESDIRRLIALDGRLRSSRAVNILVNRSRLEKMIDGYRLATAPYRKLGYPACSGQRFAQDRQGGFCTGFWVGGDLVVTAGHCLKSTEAVRRTGFIFGYTSSGALPFSDFAPSHVYFGKELVARGDKRSDFAVVKVDRTVNIGDTRPLRINRSGRLSVRTQVGLIGHPAGLPLKIAFAADGSSEVKKVGDAFFEANIDAFAGNSGSPVLSGSQVSGYQVEGILVSGKRDYALFTTYENACFAVLSGSTSEQTSFERATLIKSVIPYIPELPKR